MIYSASNGPIQTTAAFVPVTTGTAVKTMMQIDPQALVRVIEWGISFDGFAAAAPGKIELIETDVAATVTAYVANDFTKVDAEALQNGDPTSKLVTVGVSASGYTATAEGTITSVRNLDNPLFLAPSTQPFVKQFPLGREPVIQAGKFGRIRVTFGAAVNCYCYMVLAF